MSRPNQERFDPIVASRPRRNALGQTSLPGKSRLYFEPLHAFDLETERTLHCLRKVSHTVTLDSSSFDSIWNSENTPRGSWPPDMVYQPWCIECPSLEPAQSYELKSSLIHLLPKFHGLAGEDPHKHLKEFHVVTGYTGRPHQDESISILPGWSCKRLVVSTASSLQYLGDMKRMFLEKFFPASSTMTMRKEICEIRQHSDETLHEYWERFNKLCTAHVPREILPSIQYNDHEEGDL
ncbi:hypothetical protein CR513_27074, partial [Mucuna pruriens]